MGLEALLKEQGLKLTAQRREAVAQALSRRRHFSAEELYEELKKRETGISRATVYRTLRLLAEHNLLEVHDFDRGYRLYESRLGRHHHDHLVCLQCRRITEFENPDIEKEQDRVARQHHFKILSHSHKIYGVCSRCRAAH